MILCTVHVEQATSYPLYTNLKGLNIKVVNLVLGHYLYKSLRFDRIDQFILLLRKRYEVRTVLPRLSFSASTRG